MILILTAYSTTNGLITLTKAFSRDELEKMRRGEEFLCPQCKGRLMLKVGQVVIPHFAHISANDCLNSFSEGESPEHLAGKQQLFDFFQKRLIPVEVEAIIKEIGQRPDLLVDKRFAIEFQCSTIQPERLYERNSGYHKAGIQPIWILKPPHSLQTIANGVHLISLSKFNQLFIPRPISGQTLLTYDTKSVSFQYFSHLLPVKNNQFISKVRRLPISSQQFPFLSVNPPTSSEFHSYFRIYTQKRRQFLSSRVLLSRRGINDNFLRACYQLGFRPEELPDWIGVPIRGSEAFEGHAAEWQMNLVFHVLSYGSEWASLNLFLNQVQPIDRHQAIETAKTYLKFIHEIGITSLTPDAFRKPVDSQILFQAVLIHFLAKTYEN